MQENYMVRVLQKVCTGMHNLIQISTIWKKMKIKFLDYVYTNFTFNSYENVVEVFILCTIYIKFTVMSVIEGQGT